MMESLLIYFAGLLFPIALFYRKDDRYDDGILLTLGWRIVLLLCLPIYRGRRIPVYAILSRVYMQGLSLFYFCQLLFRLDIMSRRMYGGLMLGVGLLLTIVGFYSTNMYYNRKKKKE